MEANLKWVINGTIRIKMGWNILPISIVASKKYRDFKPQLDSSVKEMPVSVHNCLGLIYRIKICRLQITKMILRCMQPKYRRTDRSDTYTQWNFWYIYKVKFHESENRLILSLSQLFFFLSFSSSVEEKLLYCSFCLPREGPGRAGSVSKHIWSSCSLCENWWLDTLGSQIITSVKGKAVIRHSFRLVETPWPVSALHSNLAVPQVAICPTSGKGQVVGGSWGSRKGWSSEAG